MPSQLLETFEEFSNEMHSNNLPTNYEPKIKSPDCDVYLLSSIVITMWILGAMYTWCS